MARKKQPEPLKLTHNIVVALDFAHTIVTRVQQVNDIDAGWRHVNIMQLQGADLDLQIEVQLQAAAAVTVFMKVVLQSNGAASCIYYTHDFPNTERGWEGAAYRDNKGQVDLESFAITARRKAAA